MIEISFESLERRDQIRISPSETYCLYSESDLDAAENRLIQTSHFHMEHATSSQTRESAMREIPMQTMSAEELVAYILDLGFQPDGSSENVYVKSSDGDSMFSIGQTGPNGGTIFWVNEGSLPNGPSALECAPSNWYTSNSNEPDCPMVWAQDTDELGSVRTSDQVGAGEENWRLIDESDIFCPPLFQIGNFLGEGWYLPSIGELKLMYTNLHQSGLGDLNGSQYWSSSIWLDQMVHSLDFESGEHLLTSPTYGLYLRPVRSIRG